MTLALVIGGLCIAFLLAFGLNWLALIPWRRSVGKHWTERARLLYPAQRSASLNSWLIPLNLGVPCFLIWPDIDFLPIIISGFVGAVAASYFMTKEVFTDLTFKSWLHLIVAVLLFSFIWWFVLIFAIFEMPENFGLWTWLSAGAVLSLFLALNFGLVIHILRWLRLLRPATDHLNSLVSEVSQNMKVPVRASWIFSTYISNALAFPFTRQSVFTEKLLSTLTDEQIKAICAHELGHLSEPKKVLFMRLIVSLAFFPLVFAKPLGSMSDGGPHLYLLLLMGVLVVRLLGIRLSRRMEKRADAMAAQNVVDTAIYAKALERIYEINQTPAVMPRRATKIHPDLYDRMIAADVTPDYEKPAPAKKQYWTSYLMLACLFLGPAIWLFFKSIAAVWNSGTIHVN